ncbi:MAG: gamma-butyrobetaine hydroxylase-like domain-containing protein, partial [Thermoanaerobaculia bacterium]
PRYTALSFQLRNAVQVGNYAIQPNWMDGHEHGMWTYDRLRDLCSCDLCQASHRAEPAVEETGERP